MDAQPDTETGTTEESRILNEMAERKLRQLAERARATEARFAYYTNRPRRAARRAALHKTLDAALEHGRPLKPSRNDWRAVFAPQRFAGA